TRSIRVRAGSVRMSTADLITVSPDRIADGAIIDMGGGTFELVAGATPNTENVGLLRLSGGGNAINATVSVGSTTGTIRFTGADFEGRRAGASLNFQLDPGGGVTFTSPPALSN